jgi:sodium-dependent dicarboxylate transporter 2/3/5
MTDEGVAVESKSALVSERLSAGGHLFETWRKRLGLILTPLAFFVTYLLCDSLTPEGRKLAAIVAGIGVLWISEVIPLPVSALLGAVLCVVLGVERADKVLAHFADPIVFVFMGGFMIARSMMIHGLDRRIAIGILSVRWISSHPARVMGGLGLVTALLSMWVSNSATTAMMLPIGLGILRALHDARVARGLTQGPMNAREWPYAGGMMLMVAYGASVGGIGTPVGTPPNLIGIGLIRTATGADIGFFRWMQLAVPLFLVMGLALFGLLHLLHRDPHPAAAAGAHLVDYISRERRKLGPWTWGQVNTLIGFGVAVVLWVVPGILQLEWFAGLGLGDWMKNHMPEAIVALIAVILLFMLPVDLAKGEFTLTWREAVQIDWGTILLFGGGLTLGALMFQTGVAEAMGTGLTSRFGVSSLWALTGLSIAMAIVLSEAASNTASANMVIPVVIGIAQAAGVSPLPPALGACLGASFGFMLPVSTPPNAIVYGSGLVELPKMLRAGIIFDCIGFFIIWGGLRLLCPLLGLM